MTTVSSLNVLNWVQNTGQQSGKVTETPLVKTDVDKVLAEELTAEGVETIAMQLVDQPRFTQLEQALSRAADDAAVDLNNSDFSGILRETREVVVAASNQGQNITMSELVALIMEISLRDRDRQRDMDEVVKQTLAATAIAIQALGTEAIQHSYTGSILMSVGTMVDGLRKTAEPGHYKDATNKLATISSILGLHGANANVAGTQLDSIKDVARDLLSRITEQVDGQRNMSDASHQVLTQQEAGLVRKLGELALMLGALNEIEKGAFTARKR